MTSLVLGASTFISGLNSLASGAANLLSLFRTQKASTIIGGGKGRGFWDFYSCSVISTVNVGVDQFPEYMQETVDWITKDQTVLSQDKKYEFLRVVKQHLQYHSYRYGVCMNSICSVSYTKNTGFLKMYIYTFCPSISTMFQEKYIQAKHMSVDLRFNMAKDWIIIAHIKTNALKVRCNDELKYLDDKEINMQEVYEAIGIALTPCALGLVQVPPEFIVMIKCAFEKQEIADKPGVDPAQAQRANEMFRSMFDQQAQINQHWMHHPESQTSQSDLAKCDQLSGDDKSRCLAEAEKQKPAADPYGGEKLPDAPEGNSISFRRIRRPLVRRSRF